MRVHDAVAEFTYAKDHTPATRRFYAQKLGSFCAFCEGENVADVGAVTTLLVRRFLVQLRETPNAKTGQPMKSSTLHGYARAAKAFLRWAHQEELMAVDATRRLEMPRLDQNVVKTFTPSDIAAMFKACDTPRDRAILAILLDTGIRANELCTLRTDAVFFSPSDAFIRVDGKGRKQREISLGQKARLLLHRYLHQHRPDTSLPYVFVGRSNKPLRQEGLYRLLVRLARRAGIDGRVYPHLFRHSHSVLFIENGGDILRLSRRLGHAGGISVTEGYLRGLSSKSVRTAPSVLDAI